MKRRGTIISIAVVLILVIGACSFAAVAAFRSFTQLTNAAPAQVAGNIVPVAATSQAPVSTPKLKASNGTTSVSGLEDTVQQIYTQVNPSVVLITATQQVTTQRGFGFGQGSQMSQALGSGFVWDTQGHIVTNNHVVDGATSLEVTFPDGTMTSATVVGTDVNSDLAVIKVNVPADKLHPVSLADSTQVKVGQMVIAIGNPFGESGSLSVGFVSGLGRNLDVASNNSQGFAGTSYQIPDIIQTDAPINPGNSGGVLVNAEGNVIGVTAAIESSTNSSSGVGFAIPSVLVNRVVPSLIQSGHYDHPYLGISGATMQPALAKAMGLDANQRGVLVSDVTASGPAAKAGIQGGNQQATLDGNAVTVGGDVIVSVDGQTVNTFDDLITYLERNTTPGQKITLGIVRGGKTMSVEVTLGARPSSALGSMVPSSFSAQPSLAMPE